MPWACRWRRRRAWSEDCRLQAGGTNYQAYYDTSANLTWLADANANGTRTWSNAKSWAANLSITGYVGGTQTSVGSWRLPTTKQPDSTCSIQSGSTSYGYGCTGSEMGNLFYNVLGGTAQKSIAAVHSGNYNLFSNVQPSKYWSATEYAPNASNAAWYFDFGHGYQNRALKTSNGPYAWAVQTGDPGAPSAPDSVPSPGSLWLMGAGLTLLGLMLGRQRLARR